MSEEKAAEYEERIAALERRCRSLETLSTFLVIATFAHAVTIFVISRRINLYISTLQVVKDSLQQLILLLDGFTLTV